MSTPLRPHFADAKGIIVQDFAGDGLIAAGTSVPADAATGYASGCLFMDVDASAGAQLFVNEGTSASADFNAIAATGAGSFSSIVSSGDLTFSAAADINLPANTAAALGVDDGTTNLMVFDTRNTVKNVNGVAVSSPATTIASEAAAHVNPSLKLADKTITYTGTTGTTSQLGAMLHVGVLTITDASAMTLDVASAVHITAVAAAGGSLTITASRMISTSVSDCFLTNAGVWTDTSCWERNKEGVVSAGFGLVEDILDKLLPRTWRYRDGGEHGHDFGRQRVGVTYDEVPDELRAAGERNAVATGGLASFALAACKGLLDRCRELERRLEALESA